MDAYIGTILIWAPTFAPVQWVFCQGQTMPINGYQAVFALIGTTYGGNGTTNFNLPDLRSRVPVGAGMSPGNTNRVLGQVGGAENVTLTLAQMPAHNHTATFTPTGGGSASTLAVNAYDTDATSPSPGSNLFPAKAGIDDGTGSVTPVNIYGPAQGTVTNLLTGSGGSTGGGTVTVNPNGSSQAHPNMQPFQVLNFIMCLEGLFPPRN